MTDEQVFQTFVILSMGTILFLWALLRSRHHRHRRKFRETQHRGKLQPSSVDRLVTSFLITLLICASGYFTILIGEPFLSAYLQPEQILIVGFIALFIVLMTVIYVLLEISGFE